MHRPSANGAVEDAAAACTNGFLLVIFGAARLSTRWPVHHRFGGKAGRTVTEKIEIKRAAILHPTYGDGHIVWWLQHVCTNNILSNGPVSV